jgi:hypothetical protein
MKYVDLAGVGKPQLPLCPPCPPPQNRRQWTIISRSDLRRQKLNDRKEVFQISIRNKILLLQQDTVKKTREEIHEGEEV